MMGKTDLDRIAKTLNCQYCGQMFWSFCERELRVLEKDTVAQLVFEKKLTDDHHKVCFNKALIKEKVVEKVELKKEEPKKVEIKTPEIRKVEVKK
jgi:hypothetical protein